ncbi:unnamed protein product [Durusdinium trenchii]|uniref:SnoaL-like domain-containing protein n=2 Tax=Durusdinium trenchii TaxID=1381693 RepID=A0ABP0QG26_9DINO
MSSAIELLIAAHTALSAVPLRTLRVSCLSPPSVLVSFMDGQSLMWTPKPEPMPMPACDPGVDDSAMLGKALRWLKADCFAEFAVHEELVAANASMFGARGADEVLAFKKSWLRMAKNYEVDAILDVDLKNRVVVASFDCLISGKEGRGTDVMQFDEQMKVSGVAAIRHTQVTS